MLNEWADAARICFAFAGIACIILAFFTRKP